MTSLLVYNLPAVNAFFNGLCAFLLCCGYVAIRDKQVHTHRACMLAAFAASTLFLIGYLTRIYLGGTHVFPSVTPWRQLYLGILISHMILAVALLPLVFTALAHAFAKNFAAHKRVVRFTFPVWMYVSVTGVIVYIMLYHLAPRLAAR